MMSSVLQSYITNMELSGFIKEKIDGNIEKWIKTMMKENPNVIDGIRRANCGEPQLPYKGVLLEQNEFFGKHLTGLSFCYAMTASETVKTEGDKLVSALAQAQGNDGYIGVHYAHDRLGKVDSWDLWGHYHAIYGLLSWYEKTGSETAFEVAVKAADHCVDCFTEKSYSYGWETVNFAISHAYALLYQKKTGDQKYLRDAKRIVDEDWKIHGNWKDDALSGKQLYEMELPRWEVLHTIMTLGTLYEITGEKEYFDALEKIWWGIVKYDRHNTGGFTSGEKATGNPYAPGPIETCSCVAWLGLGVDYLRLSKNSYVADELELTYYNTLLGALTGNLREVTYDTPMDGMIIKAQVALPTIFNAGSKDFNCCQGNAVRALSEVSRWAVLTDDTALYVNFFSPSKIHTKTPKGQNIILSIEGEYPRIGDIKISVSGLDTPEEFELNVRIPTWSASSSVSVNGNDEGNVESGKYHATNRTWKNGDMVEVSLDMTLHFWVGEDRFFGKTSVYRGPLLLVIDTEYEYLPACFIHLTKEELSEMKVTDGGEHGTWIYCEVADKAGDMIHLVDFASGGKKHSHYTSWLYIDHTKSPIDSKNTDTPQWMNLL